MTEVRITVDGRSYRLDCEEGAEERFNKIAEHVSATAKTVVEEFGQVGQDRILVLTALRIADELFDAKSTDK